jgi:hypothetical protein
MAQENNAAKPSLPPNAGHLRSINIRTLKNGFIGSASYDPAKVSKDAMCCSYVPDEEYALTDREAVHAFVDAIFDTAPKPKEKAKAKGRGRSEKWTTPG